MKIIWNMEKIKKIFNWIEKLWGKRLRNLQSLKVYNGNKTKRPLEAVSECGGGGGGGVWGPAILSRRDCRLSVS